ncbi:MAG: translation initiation factor IF-2 N-terminal domain-containing protein, partial [Desulfobacteraceae bacterium]|nr:translation initiation factor IF-2 N-terminal domain-containing protein [Desulfobacteraceae bacterium]
MAKIRIYELARDLNMTNKMLLEKIRNMDIDAKSHMSSLDDDTLARIRGKILGSPAKEIEETRIKPTLIRRRKKRVRQKPVEIETSAEPELRPEKIEVEDQISEKILEDKELPPEKETKEPEKKEIAEIVAEETAGIEKESAKKIEAPDEIIAKSEVPKEKPEAEKPVIKILEKPAALKKFKPKKVTKKRKKDTPAKIIKLPVTPPPKEKEPEIEKDLVS